MYTHTHGTTGPAGQTDDMRTRARVHVNVFAGMRTHTKRDQPQSGVDGVVRANGLPHFARAHHVNHL